MVYEKWQKLPKDISYDEDETEDENREEQTYEELAPDVAIDQFHRVA